MKDTLKYLIVEDDDLDRMSVEVEAAKFPFLQKIAACAHPIEAAELIHNARPDVLFVDIEMPGINGLQLVKSMAGGNLLPVFITSHPEFALESYEIEAFDYLLKPLAADRFARCALRLRDFHELRSKAFAFETQEESGYIVIKQGYEKCKVRIQDILYVEAMKDYTRLVTPSRQYLVLATLAGMQERLPAAKFIRIHRSYIVNIDRIDGVKGNKILLSAHDLPLGKLYRHALDGKF